MKNLLICFLMLHTPPSWTLPSNITLVKHSTIQEISPVENGSWLDLGAKRSKRVVEDVSTIINMMKKCATVKVIEAD